MALQGSKDRQHWSVNGKYSVMDTLTVMKEQPHDIVEDLKNMFGRDGGAYGVVDGKTGY
jgi:hypothetical protein